MTVDKPQRNGVYTNLDSPPPPRRSRDTLPVYTVIRRGEFRCRLVELNQCGPKGTSKFEYIVTVKGRELAGNDATDNLKNFLVEHYALADLIEETFGRGRWSASCEAFCGSIIELTRREAGDRADSIHVTLKPGNIAEIQLEWTRGQSMPILLAHRV